MKKISNLLITSLVAMSAALFAVSSSAELTIQITQGVDNPTVISVVPFNYTGTNKLPEDVAKIISNDLLRSGQFNPIDPKNMLSFPSSANTVIYRDWRLLGSEYLVVGNITPVGDNYQLIYSLFDVVSQRNILFNKAIEVNRDGLRDMAHHVSDAVYEAVTGIRGAFSTSMVYVEHDRAKNRYRLIRADIDGARSRELLRSVEPLLSPSWSPDGKKIAYVSFESGRPAIFMQDVLSGQREQLTKFKGINGAPTWSPDGKKLALVLSKDGNPEIYTLNLASRQFTRVTNHFGIDTEPTWSKDGGKILFTSNRGGKPQIYQVTLSSGRAERLTFEGDYNARPQLTPDGNGIIMVHRNQGVFHIAHQNLRSGDVQVLTKTTLDESPSIAPNGASLIYATKSAGKGVLASVSLDGGARFLLPSTAGDVREPAWSPYFK